MVRTLLAGAVLAIGLSPALALDPATYGGGSCQEMAREHDPSTLYVGRFAAQATATGPGDQTAEVACFTDHKQCIRWIDRDSGGNRGHIYQMSCHRGL